MIDTPWLERAKINLLRLSENKDNFFKAKKEWVYVGIFDNEDADFDCELCGHSEIRYEYTIRNTINGNEMIIGSSCITKFIDHMTDSHEYLYDTFGAEVTVQRVEQDKFDYWEKILFTALEERFMGNDFQRSITSQIEEDGALTINQAKYLRRFYNTLGQNEQTAFRNIVKIKLRKGKQKKQFEELNSLEEEFILKLLSHQQKRRMLGE
ncbi:TPA: hypothetical protein ACOITS_002459 [Enterococcus faecalis]